MEKNNDYLYKLEDKLYRPLTNYTKNAIKLPSNDNRIMIIDWLYDVNKTRPLCFFGLTITLMDIYFSFQTTDVPQEEWQAIGCMCLSIVESMLLGDVAITKYSDFIYLTEKAYTKEDFVKVRAKIVTVLNGYLIRPSQVFFINKPSKEGLDSRIKSLITFNYYISDLMIYKPSLIAEVINFILTGNYEKYNLEEISEPCRILNKEINNIDKYEIGELKSEILDIKKYLKANCGEYISK
jgi:Cyclin, N-terminal domain